MNTFEKCCAIRRTIVNRAAEVMTHRNWSEEFATRRIRDLPTDIERMDSAAELFGIQPADMTDRQLDALGFGRWSSQSPMRLIPLWLFPFLAESLVVECIDGETKLIKKSEMDTDSRFGCLAYGIIPSDR